jgi:hypothetical protein
MNRKGFGRIAIFLVVAGILAIAGVWYYSTYKSHNTAQQLTSTLAQSASSSPSSSIKIGFSLDEGSEAYGGSVNILDISNPSSSIPLSVYPEYNGSVEDAYLSGNYLYVALSPTGYGATGGSLDILDVSNPATPKSVGDYSFSSYPLRVSGFNNYLVVGGAFGFQILDISDPTNPKLVGSYAGATDTRMVKWFDIANNKVYASTIRLASNGLTDGDGQFQIIDISNPGKPTFISTLALPPFEGTKFYVCGQYAYLIGEGGEGVYDISNSQYVSPIGASSFSIVNSQLAGKDADSCPDVPSIPTLTSSSTAISAPVFTSSSSAQVGNSSCLTQEEVASNETSTTGIDIVIRNKQTNAEVSRFALPTSTILVSNIGQCNVDVIEATNYSVVQFRAGLLDGYTLSTGGSVNQWQYSYNGNGEKILTVLSNVAPATGPAMLKIDPSSQYISFVAPAEDDTEIQIYNLNTGAQLFSADLSQFLAGPSSDPQGLELWKGDPDSVAWNQSNGDEVLDIAAEDGEGGAHDIIVDTKDWSVKTQ